MKIALFSPLNPVKTGISDYTEELLPELAKHMEVDVYIDPRWNPTSEGLKERFRILPFRADEFRPGLYDAMLYHMGNYYKGHRFIYEAMMRYPGIVVLHDYVMQGFYAERYDATGDFSPYRTLLHRLYGEAGEEIADSIQARRPVPIWESPEALRFPLNEEIIAAARGLIVHSRFVRDRIRHVTSVPLAVIPHHGHVPKSFDIASIRRELGVEDDEVMICSAGYVSRNKRYDRILSALSQIRDISYRFVIAGEDRGGILSQPLNAGPVPVRVLGHLKLERMEAVISASDICINLRYPTMGESSGSLIRMMGYAKPVLVTNDGSYAEFPDFAVLKVAPDIDEVEMIRRLIRALALDADLRSSVGREARLHVERECGLGRCAALYAGFLREFIEERGRSS